MSPETGVIYMDHAATTPCDPAVVEAMLPFFTARYGNPSSIYSVGRDAKQALEEAREQTAAAIGAKPEEIVFVGSGSESDNLAILGVAYANEPRGKHIITSAIEHHAVLDTCQFLEKRGFEVTYVKVDNFGMVDPEDVRAAITPKTILVTIMHANNEVGTVQPIAEIARITREAKVSFHTDAVQSVGVIPVDVGELGVDLLSISAHKLYGPKGVGALYVKRATRMSRIIHGGNQERRRRAGTENTAGIVGFAKALEIAMATRDETAARLVPLRDKLARGLEASIERLIYNGHPTERLPGNVNICMEAIEGESILLNLDFLGICASSGSACTSATLEPSHVLLAMGVPIEIAHGSVRFSLGRHTTEDEVDKVLEVMPGIVERLRAMSPLSI